jgi:hypothetical protein
MLCYGEYSDKGVTAVVEVPRELTKDDARAFGAWLKTDAAWAALCVAQGSDGWLDPKEPADDRLDFLGDQARSLALKLWLVAELGATVLDCERIHDDMIP